MERAVLWVMICNALVAVAAFLKDVLMASYAGTSFYADQFTLAYFLVDTISNNWLAASVGAAGVTVLARVYKERPDLLRMTWTHVLKRIAWFAAVLVIFGGTALWMLRPMGLFPLLLALMLPSVFTYAVMGAGVASSQTFRRFTIPAAAPLIMHGAILLSTAVAILYAIPLQDGVMLVSICVTLGATGSALWVLAAQRRLWKPQPPLVHLEQEDVYYISEQQGKMTRLFAGYTLLTLCSQLILYWERGLAVQLGTGVVTAVNYAYRVAQVPVWVFATAVAAVLLPQVSSMAAAGLRDELDKLIGKAVTLMLWITLPIPVLMVSWSEPLVQVLFQRGAFDHQSTAMTAKLLSGYTWAIAGYSISLLLTRCWLAVEQIKGAVLIFALSTMFTASLQWILASMWGSAGIGYGAAIGAAVQAMLFAVSLWQRGRFRWKPGKFEHALWFTIGLAAAFFASRVGLGMGQSLDWDERDDGMIRLLWVAGSLGVSYFVYIGIVWKPLKAYISGLRG